LSYLAALREKFKLDTLSLFHKYHFAAKTAIFAIHKFMKMKRTSIVLLAFLCACAATRQVTVPPQNTMVVDGKIFTALFQQRAAEYRALCYQAYNIAYLRLDQSLTAPHSKPLAIVTDIDETVLDNSAYAVYRALQGKDYDRDSWIAFTAKGIADTVPGAYNFLRYAASHGVQVFYITNREEVERAGTLQNLQKFGFPNADESHLLTKQGSSGKEARRQTVAATHDIVLLLGDNLSDFTFLFDKKSTEERFSATNSIAPEFGKKFIVLPNPNYGDWESALFKYNYGLTPQQKDSVMTSLLKGY
jgi:5'-nucleotidase (lipoprotein e(P4) family)